MAHCELATMNDLFWAPGAHLKLLIQYYLGWVEKSLVKKLNDFHEISTDWTHLSRSNDSFLRPFILRLSEAERIFRKLKAFLQGILSHTTTNNS